MSFPENNVILTVLEDIEFSLSLSFGKTPDNRNLFSIRGDLSPIKCHLSNLMYDLLMGIVEGNFGERGLEPSIVSIFFFFFFKCNINHFLIVNFNIGEVLHHDISDSPTLESAVIELRNKQTIESFSTYDISILIQQLVFQTTDLDRRQMNESSSIISNIIFEEIRVGIRWDGPKMYWSFEQKELILIDLFQRDSEIYQKLASSKPSDFPLKTQTDQSLLRGSAPLLFISYTTWDSKVLIHFLLFF